MGTFFAYSIQSSICLALFYLFYKALLSRETFHRFNRIGLLGILVLSLSVPGTLSILPLHKELPALIDSDIQYFISDISISGSVLPDDMKHETGSVFLSFLLIVYITGCLLSLLYTIFSTIRIGVLIKSGCCFANGNGTKLILLDDPTVSPCSWMKYIVLSKSDHETSGEAIIAHESAHISLRHSYDLLIAQLCIITQWFNPAAWLLYRELQHIHEYEADDAVIRKGIDIKQYQLLLIKKAVGTRLFSMANSLNHSNLLKRITMMYQKKSNPWARLKYAYVLPLAAITVALFARPEVSQPFEEISNAKVSHFALETSKNEVKNLPEVDIYGIPSAENAAYALILAGNDTENKLLTDDKAAIGQSPDDSIFTVVEKNPEFPGGEAALMKYIAESLVYPQIAMENGIGGRIYCKFVVEKDGSVSNVEVTRAFNQYLDREAIRVLKSLPKFKPGTHKGQPVRVYYSVPVTFKISSTNNPPSNENSAKSGQKILIEVEDQDFDTGYDEDHIFTIVEKNPVFPGGEVALMKYIQDNIIYPSIAAENGIQGRSFCEFVVNKDGSVSDVCVLRAFNQYLDREAIRVLKSLPKFIPGEQRGKPVRVKYSVPVSFTLKTDENGNNQPDKVDVENKQNSNFQAYPSPANDVLYIDIDHQAILAKYAARKTANNPTYNIRLYNTSGTLVIQTITSNNKTQLNTSKIPDGIYFIHLFDGIDSNPEVKQILIRH